MSGEDKQAFKNAVARFDQEIIDLESVVDDQVKLCRRVQEALRNEVLGTGEGVAARNLGVGESVIKKLKELSNAITAAVAAQTTLQKTAKQRAAALGPEEMQIALRRAILALPYQTRRDFIVALVAAHNERRRAAVEAGLEEARVTRLPGDARVLTGDVFDPKTFVGIE